MHTTVDESVIAREESREMIAEFDTLSGGRALHIMRSDGEILTELAMMGFDAYGLDIREHVAESRGRLAKYYPNPAERVREYSGGRMPFEDDSFDFVHLGGVLTGGIENAREFREILRVTKIGGYVMYAVRNDKPSLTESEEAMSAEGLKPVLRRVTDYRLRPMRRFHADPFRLTSAVEEALNALHRRHYFSFLPENGGVVVTIARKESAPEFRGLDSSRTRTSAASSPPVDAEDRLEPNEARVRRLFDRSKEWQGDIYDRPVDRFRRAVVRRQTLALDLVKRTIPDSDGKSVLDAGCGAGTYLESLRRDGWNIFGMDLSEVMVEYARLRLGLGGSSEQQRIIRGGITSIPFEPASFDLVLCVGVLGYVDDVSRAVDELSRVVNPGGYLLVSVDNAFSLANADFTVRRMLAGLFNGKHEDPGRTGGQPRTVRSRWMRKHSPAHVDYRLFDPWSLESWLGRKGFDLTGSTTFGYELRWLRASGIVRESRIESLERKLEGVARSMQIPFVTHSGDVYIGMFKKGSATV